MHPPQFTNLIPVCERMGQAVLFAVFFLSGLVAQDGAPGSCSETPAAKNAATVGGGFSGGGGAVAAQLQRTISELDRTKRLDAIEAVVESTMRRHANDWQVLFQGARIYAELERVGYWVNQGFRRGDLNGRPPTGARRVYSHQRDHVRALQLLDRAVRLAAIDPNPAGKAAFYWEAAQILTGEKAYFGLYELTDLTKMPTLDFHEPRVPDREPVPLEGEEERPQFFELPESWHTARNDGERLLWLLTRARDLDADYEAEAEFIRAKHLLKGYLGVQTIAEHEPYRSLGDRLSEALENVEAEVGGLDGLSENESVAVVGEGEIRKFPLPDEQNFILRLERMSREPKYREFRSLALEELAEVFENRRQYDRAARYWKALVAIEGEGTTETTPDGETIEIPSWEQERLHQIIRSWGRFEDVQPVQVGEPLDLGYWYRNGREVTFTAHRVDVPALVDDLLEYLRGDPYPIDPDRINVSKLGLHLVNGGGDRYLKEKVTEWSQALTASEKHWDQRIAVRVPIEQPGAYLVEAKIDGGHRCSVLVWINDLSILRRPLENGLFYYVADKQQGTPVGWVKFTFVGYRLTLVNQTEEPELDIHGEEVAEALKRQYHVVTREITKWADAKGQLILDDEVLRPDFRWFLLATAPSDRVAVLGFSDLKPEVMAAEDSPTGLRQALLTDRSVYLPGQTCRFRGWIRAKAESLAYEAPQRLSATVVLRNHRDEILADTVRETDAMGGFVGEFPLPRDFSPGTYRLQSYCQGTMVESELVIEPLEPVPVQFTLEDKEKEHRLATGTPWKLTVRGRSEAGEVRVAYRVVRERYRPGWERPTAHAWLFGEDYDRGQPPVRWYEGWANWGWEPQAATTTATEPRGVESHLLCEGELVLDGEGNGELEIPTELLAGTGVREWMLRCEVWPVATPEVRPVAVEKVVSDRPFKVYAKVDCPYYRVGDEVVFEAWARRHDGLPVTGQGELVLYQVHFTGERGKPVEWGWKRSVPLTGEGTLKVTFPVPEAGRYRASYTLTDAQGERIEGACVFLVVDDAYTGETDRFNSLEILADRVIYQPGDRVRLRINTENVGQSVAIFVRPRGGVIGRAEVIRLEQRSTAYDELTVKAEDVPSFFVEAIILNEGEFEVHTKEIRVAPPAVRLQVVAGTTQSRYRPGDEVKLLVSLADAQGDPVSGDLALSITPLAVDGHLEDHRPDLEDLFWNLRRPYTPSVEHGLKTEFHSFSSPPEARMRPVGIFGSVRMGGATEPPETIGIEEEGRERPNDVRPYASPESALPAIWEPLIRVDESGHAEVTKVLPDTEGRWRVRVWALDETTRAGSAAFDLKIRRDWFVDLDVPAHAVVGDRFEVIARVANRMDEAAPAPVVLEMSDGFQVQGEIPKVSATLAPKEEREWRWEVVAVQPSEGASLDLRVGEGEACERREEVMTVHSRFEESARKWAAKLPGAATEEAPAQWEGEFRLPADLIEEDSRLVIEAASSPLERLAPMLRRERLVTVSGRASRQAANLLDVAAPILTFGKWLREMEEPFVRERIEVSPLAWVLADDSLEQLAGEILESVWQMQRPDGGWGLRYTDALETVSVIEHLLDLRDLALVEIEEEPWERGVTWLVNAQEEQLERLRGSSSVDKREADTLDAFIDLVLVRMGRESSAMRDFLFRDWRKLSVLGRVMLAQGLHRRGETADRNVVRFALGERLEEDDEAGTVRLGPDSERFRWEWYGSAHEVQARYLEFLQAIKGDDPVTDGAARQLLEEWEDCVSHGTSRETSRVLRALAAFGRLKGWRPAAPSAGTLSLWRGEDEVARSVLGDGASLWAGHRVEVDGAALASWVQPETGEAGTSPVALKLRHTGEAPLWLKGRLEWRRQPLVIAAVTSPEVSLRRRYHRAGAAEPVRAGEPLALGESIRVELTLETEGRAGTVEVVDWIPAGFALAGDLPEGWTLSIDSGELRGLASTFDKRREQRFAYEIRAVREGLFHALPARVEAPHLADWGAASEEMIFQVSEPN